MTAEETDVEREAPFDKLGEGTGGGLDTRAGADTDGEVTGTEDGVRFGSVVLPRVSTQIA